MAHEPTRSATTVKVDPKGNQTSAQGGPISNTPRRTPASGARPPQRTTANIPVHNLRETGSPSTGGTPGRFDTDDYAD